MPNKLKKIKRNLLIIIVGWLLGLGIFYVQESGINLQASIFGIHDQETLNSKQYDIAYKLEDDLIQILFDSKLKWTQKVELSIRYDSENVKVDLDNVQTQFDYKILSHKDGKIKLEVSDVWWLDINLFAIPFVGENPYILLSEAKIIGGSDNKSLAIWSI